VTETVVVTVIAGQWRPSAENNVALKTNPGESSTSFQMSSS